MLTYKCFSWARNFNFYIYYIINKINHIIFLISKLFSQMSMSKLTPADFIDKNSENVECTKDGAEGSSKITVKNVTHFT